MDKYTKEINIEIQVAEAVVKRIDDRLESIYDMLFKIKHVAENILEKDIDAYLSNISSFDPERYSGFTALSDEEADIRYNLYDEFISITDEIESREQEVKEILDTANRLVWGARNV